MAFCVAVACLLLRAQSGVKLEFEIASLKTAAPPTDMQHGPVYGGPGTASPGQIAYTNLTLKYLIELAYNVNRYQLSAPSWTDEERFDASAQRPATNDESLQCPKR
jgi:uncharacterized protein (TIGR03435 family)